MRFCHCVVGNNNSHCVTICDDAVVCCNAYLSEDDWQDHGWIPQVIVRGLARSVAQCTAEISVLCSVIFRCPLPRACPAHFRRPLTVSLQCRCGCPQKLKTPSIVNKTSHLSGLPAETNFMDSHPSRQACHPERSCHPVHVGPDSLGSPCASKLCRRRSMPSRDASIRSKVPCKGTPDASPAGSPTGGLRIPLLPG